MSCTSGPTWIPWALSQYPTRCPIVRSCKVSEPRHLCLELNDCSEIWQAPWQQCCRCLSDFKVMRWFKVPTSWLGDFTRCYDTYWIGGGPTGLRVQVLNRGRLENRSHMVPKTVSRWWWPNSDIYSQNNHFGLVYDMIYQFFDMEAKNYKFGMQGCI